MTQSITILGSTGSIGNSTLDVVARHPDRWRVHALTCHSRIAELAAQCLRFLPDRAVVANAADAHALREQLGAAGAGIAIDHGTEALCEVAAEADVVMAAIVGAAGLPSAMAAARAGRRVLLANKEALVMAGALFMDAIASAGATLLPIDSEHNAIFQCLPHDASGSTGGADRRVSRILLTASGGPFRTMPLEQMADVTPDQACAHPNWAMGRKISVDSATMMNKGLEVIEARWLFGVTPDRLEVVIHPQSVIHSMVEYVDGSVLAQMGNPDMRTPIAHALAYPERIVSGVGRLDLPAVGRLDFEKPDLLRFPCLQLAYHALQAGGSAPAVLNAANEIAVGAFLEGRIRFTAIARIVERVLDETDTGAPHSLEEVLAVDAEARVRASAALQDHDAIPSPRRASAAMEAVH
ncbi:MAG: 1-deoxy-D-xylulose-5-phosphate reductoisomerase [Burkholderiaceae bacterium]